MKANHLLFATLSLMFACGAGNDASTDHGGVFAISSWTLDEGCDGDATSIAGDHDPLLQVDNQKIFGQDTVFAVVCADDQACADRFSASYEGPIDATFRFTDGSDDEGFTGFEVTFGSGFENDCEGSWADVTLESDGATLTITMDRTAQVPFEPDAEGFCTSTAARDAAEGLACAEREVLTATRR